MSSRTPIPEKLKQEIISYSNNRCCVCQTPFIQFHHIDEDSSNNDPDNIAPLCPNCHSQAHSKSQLTNNLTPERIKVLRNKWYEYCEKRKEGLNISSTAILKVKNFYRSVGSPQYGWKKTFVFLSPEIKDMTADEIIERVFSSSNRDEIVTSLVAMKYMFGISNRSNEKVLQKFKNLCYSFGVDFDELE